MTSRDEWKCAWVESGAPFVMTSGTVLMLVLCVSHWDTPGKVSLTLSIALYP